MTDRKQQKTEVLKLLKFPDFMRIYGAAIKTYKIWVTLVNLFVVSSINIFIGDI